MNELITEADQGERPDVDSTLGLRGASFAFTLATRPADGGLEALVAAQDPEY